MENVPTPEVHEQEVSIEPRVKVVAPYSEDVVTVPKSQLKDALEQDYTIATPGQVKEHVKREKYSTATQRAITAAEGLAEGAIPFGGASAFETKVLGVNPEDIRSREEVNPVIKGTAGVAGLVGSEFIPYYGAANLYSKAGKALTQIPKVAKVLGEGATTGSKIAQGAAKGAFETALFSGGEEIAKKFKEDPEQSAYTAAANIGLGTLFGGMGGATLSAIGAGASSLARSLVPEQWVSELEKPALEAGEFNAGIKHAPNISDSEKNTIINGLRSEKRNAPEIKQAASELGITPLEGMVLDNEWVGKAEDALINGAPTIAGVARRKLYNEVYQTLENKTDDLLGKSTPFTKAQQGNLFKENLANKINEQAAPIEAAYNALKQQHVHIPLKQNAAEALELTLRGDPEIGRQFKSSAHSLGKDIIQEVQNLSTVDDLKSYASSLKNRVSPTAPAGEKRIINIFRDALSDLEEKSIIGFAEKTAVNPAQKEAVLSLISQRKEANKLYKPFIEKVSRLSEKLGKRRIYGKQDALNFIADLTPEEVVQKLHSLKDSEFRKFFSEEFPFEARQLGIYQKNIMREAATKDGAINFNRVLKEVGKLEPEIQNQIFTQEELSTLKNIKTVSESLPKNYNPSGTSHQMAMRDFFHSPTGAAYSNIRDLGIDQFIKGVSSSSEMGMAKRIADFTIKGEQMLKKATKALFNKKESSIPVLMLPAVTPNKREKVKKHIDEYSQHPERLMDLHNNPGIPQEYAQAFGQISASALQYLSSLKPKEDRMSPFDSKPVVNKVDEDKYNRAIDIAEQPYSILEHIKNGTIIPQDVATIHNIYPKLYDMIAERLTGEMMEQVSKDKSIPYKTMIGISLFIGKPMDSTMTPMAIQANQPKGPEQGPQDAQPQGSKQKHSMTALNKLPGQYQTPDQARSASRGQS